MSEPFLLAVPFDEPHLCTAALLDQKPFIAPLSADGEAAQAGMLAACERAGFTPDFRNTATGPLCAMAMVGAGIGYAFVQRSLLPIAPPDVTLIEPPAEFDLEMEIHMVWRSDGTALARRFCTLAADGN